MRAAVLYGNHDIRCTEIPTPAVRPGTVRLRVRACGICASDLPRVFAGGAHSYPIVLGHEFAGTIDAVGDGVTSLRPGDRAAAVPLIPCGQCPDCRAGRFSLCRHYTFLGSRIQGGFAEYAVLPEANAVPMADHLSFAQGALFEPCSVARHAVGRSGLRRGSTAVVLGGGTVGSFAAQWARLFGAERVVVFGRGARRMEAVRRLGVDAVRSFAEAGWLENALAETPGGGGFDVVFDAAGVPETRSAALRLAAGRGTICLIGTPIADVCFTRQEWELIGRRELHLVGSWMSGGTPWPGSDWTETAACFADGRIRYDEDLFGAVFPLTQVDRAFAMFEKPRSVTGRILLTMDGEEPESGQEETGTRCPDDE